MSIRPNDTTDDSHLSALDLAGDFDATTRELLRTTLAPLFDSTARHKLDVPAKTFADLQWDQLIEILTKGARTPEGYYLLEHLAPPSDRACVEQRFDEVHEVMQLLQTDAAPPLGGLRDIRQALHHVSLDGSLVIEDLDAISRNCDVAARVHRYFQSRRDELKILSRIGALIDPLPDLRSALSQAIEPGGQLSDLASPDLGKLRRAVQNQQDRLSTRVDQLLKSGRFDAALQDDYVTLREERYVLPVRIGAKSSMPGIVHAYSSSGRTAFIEPEELIELNNQLRWAQIELQDEIDRILRRLSQLVGRHARHLFRNIELLAYLDVVLSFAHFGRAINASIPRITHGKLELKGARHPLLDLKLRSEKTDKQTGEENEKKQAVPNDIAVDRPRHVLIISGPNTGGKTVSLKTTGLCALMARFGLPLPVDEGSSIPLFTSIFTDIGDEQSIERDLSTFSGHVINIRGFLPRCDPDTLVLLDELFVGTDPLQGAALAVSLLEELAARGSTTIVTTHLEGLKTLAYHSDSFANASMGFDLDTLSPTYEMTMGIPGSSFAVRIAQRLGLNQTLIDRAQSILEGQDHHSVEEVLEGLEEQVRELKREKNRLRDSRQQAERREKKFREKYNKLLTTERSEIFDETETLRRDLRQARNLIRQQLKELRKQTTVEAGDEAHRRLQEAQTRLQGAESTLENARDRTRPPRSSPEGLVAVDPDELEEGMTVFCRPFKRTGELLSFDLDVGQARVQIGDLKVNVDLDALFHPSEARRRDHARARVGTTSPSQDPSALRTSDEPQLLPQTSDNAVDLRGMRVDEALERVELFLDHAYLNHLEGVYIIHGHGTGALKRAVRGHLPQSRYVDTFRRGERGEGGDGVTIAFIKREA